MLDFFLDLLGQTVKFRGAAAHQIDISQELGLFRLGTELACQ